MKSVVSNRLQFVRPNSHAAQYLSARQNAHRSHPAISDWVRSRRLIEASFDGLIARLRIEGWTNDVIKAALLRTIDKVGQE